MDGEREGRGRDNRADLLPLTWLCRRPTIWVPVCGRINATIDEVLLKIPVVRAGALGGCSIGSGLAVGSVCGRTDPTMGTGLGSAHRLTQRISRFWKLENKSAPGTYGMQ